MCNYKKSLLFLIFVVACSFTTKKNSDDNKEKVVALLKKSKNYYEKQNEYKFNTSYDLYANNSNKAIESYSGFFIKKNKNYYSKIGQTEFIITTDRTIKIDNESKLIQHFKGEPTEENVLYDLVKYCDNFGTFDLSSNEKYWICTLNSREVTFVPYSKVVIYLSKKDCSIVKQELFLISQITTKDAKGKDVYSYPKLQITFSDFKIEEQKLDYFKTSNYIEYKKGRYYPVKKYSSYQIVD